MRPSSNATASLLALAAGLAWVVGSTCAIGCGSRTGFLFSDDAGGPPSGSSSGSVAGSSSGTPGSGSGSSSGGSSGSSGGSSGGNSGSSGGGCSTSGSSSGPLPPSCAAGGAGLTNCGPTNESCCTSLEVPGGTFYRSYDGLSPGYTSRAYPATVSGFRLDKYEVTVGRFRQFVVSVVCGWLPAAGSGKHSHLNGGKGLNATGGGYETGWDVTWDGNLPTTTSGWNSSLTGGASPSTGSTWTATAGSSEGLPVTEANWYAAYAFCIWDGGFLPSEAEWNYAAAGGSDQRAYPWSPMYPPGSTSITCSDANYTDCPAGKASAVGSDSPTGDGRWGQSDLAGNAWEWNLDWLASYSTPCTDCVNLTAASKRVVRSGNFLAGQVSLLASDRNSSPPQDNWDLNGVRCARSP